VEQNPGVVRVRAKLEARLQKLHGPSHGTTPSCKIGQPGTRRMHIPKIRQPLVRGLRIAHGLLSPLLVTLREGCDPNGYKRMRYAGRVFDSPCTGMCFLEYPRALFPLPPTLRQQAQSCEDLRDTRSIIHMT
jgi:hypothetical protein